MDHAILHSSSGHLHVPSTKLAQHAHSARRLAAPNTSVGRRHHRCTRARSDVTSSNGHVSDSDAVKAAQNNSTSMLSRRKLDLLEEMKQRSASALNKAGIQMIDARMYQATLDMQKRSSKKLSEMNKYVSYLEQRLQESNESLEEALDFMKKVAMEFGTTSRLAESTAAAVRFGLDKEDAVVKITKMVDRLKLLEQAVQAERDSFKSKVAKRVPVTWVGIASEVRLVGDFDGWTRGFELSASDIDTDSTFRTFEAEVPLLPGCYRVKFMVDGQWRLAPDWPMEQDSMGETNNVLLVE